MASLLLPPELWLASSSPLQAIERKLKPLQSQVVQADHNFEYCASDLSYARLSPFQSESMGLSE